MEDKMFSLFYTTLDIVVRETLKKYNSITASCPDFLQIVKIELY